MYKRQVQEGLKHNAGRTGAPTFLQIYDPERFDGAGRAAIAIGDPDAAANTAVVVPGTSHSVTEGWLSSNDAANVFNETRAADPSRSTSVIAWMGYDAPDGYRDPRVASPWLAREGGLQLAQDVNGLRATHQGPHPHVTMVGHSYGSTTVSDALAASGARANDVILLGSPGTDLAHSVKDFHVEGGNVFVGSASSDPVSWLGEAGGVPNELNEALGYPFGRYAGLGTDPAGDGFGSIRFKAEVPGGDGLSSRNHSHYYDLGGEPLRAMAHVVTGHADALARDDLLARGRRQPHITTPSEVKIPGRGPIRLPHIDTRIPGIPAFIDPEAERPREGAP